MDPQSFFYVREWGCRPGATVADVVSVLGLRAGEEAAFGEGTARVERDRGYELVFVVPHANAVFLFARDIGFSDFAERLSASGGDAYVIFLDDKRGNILCTRSVDGTLVRQLQDAQGAFEQEGEPVAGEPRVSHLDDETVLALATAWGPDPRELVRAAPGGTMYRRAR
jgi:hypothetical protein